MAENIEQLLASVRLLRDEYKVALEVRRELIETRRPIADEVTMWARYGCNHAPGALREAERRNDGR